MTLRLIAADYDELRSGLNTETCLFTKFIAPGIGAAEDPKTGESFGQSRMRLVSRGIVDAWYGGLITSAARLAAIDTAFKTAGLSLRSPHLNGGSADFCGWPA
jgi:HopA1 effector protein family